MILARHIRPSALSALLIAAAAPLPLWAQSGRVVAAQTTAAVDALERPARLAVRNVQLGYALTKLYERSGVPISFSPSLLPRITVSCDCDTVPVARALEQILSGSGLQFHDIDGHVLVYRPSPVDARSRLQVPSRYALSIPKGSPRLSAGRVAALRLPRVGTIIGTVSESGTGTPIVNAQVAVDGAGRALTDEAGRYRITSVPPGRRSVSVTSIGYKGMTKGIEVGDGATVTLDFALEVHVSKLDAVVVTVTGEQRVRELGHVVERINVDSLIKLAPVSNLTEILTGRVPGLQVFQTQGIVGGDVQLQIRTPNSLLLRTQPIVIVDGARYTSDPAIARGRRQEGILFGLGSSDGGGIGAANVESTSPLNDLNINDIETIEVVKGSSAATLYGTDASNGVIVITTKRGSPGPARWNAYVRAGMTETPKIRPPSQYLALGTRPNGTPYANSRGPLNCSLANVASGACMQDSITVVPNPSPTIFENAPTFIYGLNVSGGTPGVRYYVGGSFHEETGPIRMPQAFVDSIEAARGSPLPEEQLRPNALRNISLRSNLTVASGERLQVQGNLAYVRRTNRTMNLSNPWQAGSFTAGQPWGGDDNNPAEVFSSTSVNEVDRFLFSSRAEWRPTRWLLARAGAGLDLGNQASYSLTRPGETTRLTFVSGVGTVRVPETGEVQHETTQQRSITADLGLTASVVHGRVSSRTSLGAQYARSVDEVQRAWGRGLIPGGASVSQADERSANHLFNERVTLGSYAEQTFGLNDRFFLTAALRMDGASNFGHDYEAAIYPKASASWIISEEPFLPRIPGLDELRLRYAFGVSGQQAYSWMVIPSFTTTRDPVLVDGTSTTGIEVDALGNADLRPERASEHEFGFDLAALDNRVHAGLAWYRRRVVDQIVNQRLPLGLDQIQTNLGLTTARGFEARLAVNVIDTRLLSWNLNLLHSSSSTLLVDIGDGLPFYSRFGGYVEGFPLGARFQAPFLGYEDANGNGIIEFSEVQQGDTAVYVGVTAPPRTQTLNTVFGLFDGRLRISATFHREAGALVSPPNPCNFSRCLALVDPSTPLEEQAYAMYSDGTQTPPVVRGDATRFNELSATVGLPSSILEPLGLRSGMLSVSARNLALWTAFPGGDPQSVRRDGLVALNGDTFSNGGIPQARSWTFRFDVGF